MTLRQWNEEVLFSEIKKISKPLDNLTQQKKKTQINKGVKNSITVGSTKVQKSVKENSEQLYYIDL